MSSHAADENANVQSNTYLLDPESPEEMARLINLDRITTRAMGGPLSGLSDEEVAGLHNVLDLGCGPGGWVLDVAFSLPDVEVAGVDISRTMVDYANARARSQKLANASFGIMDITQPLDFADGAFDLVNWRFLVSVLRHEAWMPFLAECTRVLRSGGILRATEMVDDGSSNSPAYEQWQLMMGTAMERAGYGFEAPARGTDITLFLPKLLRSLGYQQVQIKAHALEFSAGTEAWADRYRHIEVLGYLAQSFLTGTGVMTQEAAEQMRQQILVDMQKPDFCGMWRFMTVWGKKP
jgi:SAM-dependent methyltransferase